MGNIILKKTGADWSIGGNNDLLLSPIDSALRLRGRATEDETAECVAAFNFDDFGPVMDGAADALPWFRDHMYGGYANGHYVQPFDKVNQRYGAACLKYGNVRTSGRFFLNSVQRNLQEFTIDVWIYFFNIGTANYLFADNISVAGARRWYLQYTGATEIFRFVTADVGLAADIVDADCSVAGLANGVWYQVRITYRAATTSSTIEVRARVGDVLMGAGISNTAKVMPQPVIADSSGLVFGGLLSTALVITNTHNACLIDDLQMYSKQLASSFTRTTAAVNPFATQSDVATVTLDSSADGSLWDMSTFEVDDSNQWAASVGADGWEVRYEASGSVTPSTYSAWMTLMALKAEADPTARYLHLEVRCNSSGLTSFYPFRWIKVIVNAIGLIVAVNESTLDAAVDDGTGTSVTLSITPPAAGDYSGTKVLYRKVGTTNWTTFGTYVGTQGVRGTQQVTGLSNRFKYEFCAVAFYSTNYAYPSNILTATPDDGSITTTGTMLDNITGTIVKTLLDNSNINSIVGSRVHPDESNINPDADFPCITINVSQEGRLAGANAAEIICTITAFADGGRAEALDMQKKIGEAVDNIRMSNTVDTLSYSGVLQNVGSVEAFYEEILEKWYAESEWEGKFIQRN